MAERKSAKGFTDEERAAMKERSRELKARRKADGESDVLEKIAEMSEPDRAMAEKIHALVKAAAPDLTPRTWHGALKALTAAQEERIVALVKNAMSRAEA